MKKSIWYDVSGLYEWQGSFTGIQRVVYNIAKYLATDVNVDAHFFIYQNSSFIEISFDQLEQRIRENAKKVTNNKNGQKKTSIRSLQHSVMVFGKSIVIGSRFEKSLRLVYDGLRNTYRSLQSPKITSAKIIFNKDDIVIVADGNWQFRNFAKSLIEAKKEVGCKVVHLVNDLVALKNPALANTGADKLIGSYFRLIFADADLLLAISEHTKKDIEWFIDESDINYRPPIKIITLGSDINQSIAQKKPNLPIPRDFILSVGTIEVRKNYMLLYYAYKQALSQGYDMPHLFIVGRKGWLADETYSLLTNDVDVNKYVTIMNEVDDSELEWLYEHCLFTVYPSLYEGWGLPIAESLLRGKCCISSDTSSMPEVGGRLVRYVSPYDTTAMLNAIKELSEPSIRNDLEVLIKSEYHPIAWQDTYNMFNKAILQTKYQ